MAGVFISYSRRDFYFAQDARMKLEAADVEVWTDTLNLRAGDDWKREIDRGIDECAALLVVLSPNSTASSYVTYEWASAMGKGKPIIPVLVEACEQHPKLAAIQHVDFSSLSTQPWEVLAQRVREVQSQFEDTEDGQPEVMFAAEAAELAAADPRIEQVAGQVLGYLDARGFRMVSFERVRERVDATLTDEWLAMMVRQKADTFRAARLRGGKPGLAKR